MQLMDNSQFGIPQYGQQYGGFSLPQFGGFAGPSGFAGDMSGGGLLGQGGMGAGMFGQDPMKKKGMNPMMFGMGLLPGLLAQHPGYALPALFGAAGLGLHALKVF